MEKQKWENNYPTPGGMSSASHCYIQKAVGGWGSLGACCTSFREQWPGVLHPSTHSTSCCNERRDRFLLDVTNQDERENSSTDMREPLPHPEHEDQQYLHFSMGRSIVVSTDTPPSIQSWLQVAKDLSLVKSEEVIL